MIGYYVIVAVLPIYLRSINAQSTYTNDIGQIEARLSQEVETLNHFNGRNRELMNFAPDPVCDSLDNDGKQGLCDKIMKHMIDNENVGEFESFVETDSSLAVPQLADPSEYEAYSCKKIYVDKFLVRRMLWCKSRPYKTKSGNIGEMEGFFCAVLLHNVQSAYAFRPPEPDSEFVKPVGRIINADIVPVTPGHIQLGLAG